MTGGIYVVTVLFYIVHYLVYTRIGFTGHLQILVAMLHFVAPGKKTADEPLVQKHFNCIGAAVKKYMCSLRMAWRLFRIAAVTTLCHSPT